MLQTHETYKKQVPYLVSRLGFKIVLINHRYYSFDQFQESTTASKKHTVIGKDITEWLNSQISFQVDGNTHMDDKTLETAFQIALDKQPKEIVEFHESYPWIKWTP